jgi:RNase H-fold protein (predicted Holliday junction resolvase)
MLLPRSTASFGFHNHAHQHQHQHRHIHERRGDTITTTSTTVAATTCCTTQRRRHHGGDAFVMMSVLSSTSTTTGCDSDSSDHLDEPEREPESRIIDVVLPDVNNNNTLPPEENENEQQQHTTNSTLSLLQVQAPSKTTPTSTSTSTPTSKMGMGMIKSIGVDYGLVRTGIAITIGYNPRALDILMDYNGNSTHLAHQICAICQREEATQIVMGLPLDKDGTETGQAFLTRDFAQVLLEEALRRMGPSLKLYLWDERYTSKLALAHVKNAAAQTFRSSRYSSGSGSGTSSSDVSRALVDADSACIILEDFYKEQAQAQAATTTGTDSTFDAEEVVLWEDGLRNTCLEEYAHQQEQKQQQQQVYQEQRSQSYNARQDAMQKVRDMEAASNGTGTGNGSKKKKKKKKAAKRRSSSSGGGATWQTLG